MSDTVPVLDEAKLDALGKILFARWQMYVTDRKAMEERWMKNLRQVRKIYDPEVETLIPPDRSKAYPGVTQWVVRGTIARLMQMLFPQSEKNYGVKASPLPDVSTDQLQQILDGLVRQKAQDGTPPAQVVLATEEIETAIAAFAKGKAERMELKLDDDLQAMEFPTIARKVVRSATIYNIGIACGPQSLEEPTRRWEKDAYTGAYKAIEDKKFKPCFEHRTVWDHYPDMTAKTLDKQDGCFDRHVMIRADVEALAARRDFFGDRIMVFLAANEGGNYLPQWWESQIKGEVKSAQAPVANVPSRKFEALSWWGSVSGHDLRAAGVSIADTDLGKTFYANAWTIKDVLIKLKLSPYKDGIRYHHYFVFEDDDLSILGNGQCDTLRDTQLSICEVTRAALDNVSVIGPMVEVNDDLLTPGQDVTIQKHKTWRREGDGARANLPAVRNISVESHLGDLRALLDVFMMFAEKESGLPAPAMGDISGGGTEALRTTKNMSALLGSAALPIRDTVRNYDSFTISLISALVAWNTKFAPDESRDGDHDVIARGSTSLIAKEVLAESLNEFRQSITPDEAPHINTRALLVERMKSHDLPVSDILESEDNANRKIDAQAQQAQAQGMAATDLIHAQVHEALSAAFKNAALARKADGSITVEVFEAIVGALEAGAKVNHGAHKALADHVKADAAQIAANKPAAGGA